MSLRKRLRAKIHGHLHQDNKKDIKPLPGLDDQFYDVSSEGLGAMDDSEDSDTASAKKTVGGKVGAKSCFSSVRERQAYEDHLTQIQDQLVSAMIENQSLAPGQRESQELPIGQKRSRIDRVWEWVINTLYNTAEDFSELTRPVVEQPKPVQPLTMKTLKENVRRFKVAAKPYMDTVKGIQTLMLWKSRSYTFLVLCLLLYVCWRGWLLPLLFFLGVFRMIINYFQNRGFNINFAYFPVTEDEKNGLGAVADGLEKMKNLFTWRHHEGARKLLSMLIMGFVMTMFLPSTILWRVVGVGMVVKLFIVNKVYNMYPRIQRRYDSNLRLWEQLPTNRQYDRQLTREEMDKYIVVHSESRCEEETSVLSDDSDGTSSSSEDSDDEQFRELFSLPVSESPIKGWSHGRRTVLVGKERWIVTLLSKKMGKLYMTKSFLCFAREKSPSVRNIVIPLRDIVSVDKIKINQRLPGRGMTIQVVMRTDGKDNVLHFGGIIGRDEVVKAIEQGMVAAKLNKRTSDGFSRRSMSAGSSTSSQNLIQNFTFGAYYEDSE
ncbi:GRAM4-like protein [Mya arenaria]|uniref:GRAM4-like protein n=1 Tax=Mya arenaria TaxID=6604 RepID=A0ABY7G4D5_MYAAR|nr:GRAM4-like protein [Mya arenaria]